MALLSRIARFALWTWKITLANLRQLPPLARPQPRPCAAVRVVNSKGSPLVVTLIGAGNAICKTDCWGRANVPLTWLGDEVTVHGGDREELTRLWLPQGVDGVIRIEVPSQEQV